MLTLTLTLSVPMLVPYMWYQKVRHMPLVEAIFNREVRRAMSFTRRGADVSMYT